MGNTTAAPMKGIASKDRITADDVTRLRREMFADGVVTRGEAETLLALDSAAAERCAEWEPLLVEAVTDYIVRQEEPFGYISAENADWLVGAVSSGRLVGSAAGLELLVKALEDAKYSPPGLSAFALRQVMHAVVEGKGPLMAGGSLVPGRITSAEVELLRRILYAFGGDGNIAITRAEAEILFTINERTASADNDPEWNDLFVKAIANFVMCSCGYEPPRREEALRRDHFFATSDPDVGGFLGRMLSGGMQGVLEAYRTGADIDSGWEVRNRANEALARRAERIDGGEAKWLADRIGRDGVLHDNERALLQFLKQASPSIHPVLQPLIEKAAS